MQQTNSEQITGQFSCLNVHLKYILPKEVISYVFIAVINILTSPSDYRNNLEYWDRQARASSVDTDQMLQKAASDQGLQFAIHTALL